MELEKRTINRFEPVLDVCANQEEHTDCIVPDASPDIMKILGAFGNAFLKEKTSREGKVILSGVAEGCVLYVSEGDQAVRRIEVSLPFSHVVESQELSADVKLLTGAKLVCMEAREINPRKINVRAEIAFCVQAYRENGIEIVCGVCDDEDLGIEKKCVKTELSVPVAIRTKKFTVADDIPLPAGKAAFASILLHDVQLVTGETKIIGNKAVVKGSAKFKCLYMTPENEVSVFTGELPFSQIVDVDGMSEDCELTVKMELRGAEFLPQPDLSGTVTALMASLPVELSVVACAQTEVTPIVDAYSTRYPLDMRLGETKLPQRAERAGKRIAISETLPCETPVKTVIDLSIAVGPGQRSREEGGEAWINPVTIRVLYLGEDGILSCATKKTEALCPLPENPGYTYRAEATVQGENCNIGIGNELGVRFYLDYDIVGAGERGLQTVEYLAVDSENRLETAGLPSVIIKYVTGNESLWELAKRYRTTTADILAANDLEEETVKSGDMVLIPRNR